MSPDLYPPVTYALKIDTVDNLEVGGTYTTIRKHQPKYSSPSKPHGYVNDGKRKFLVYFIKYQRIFKHLAKFEIELNHTPEDQTKEGLLASMQKFYTGFTEGNVVSVFVFTVVKEVSGCEET